MEKIVEQLVGTFCFSRLHAYADSICEWCFAARASAIRYYKEKIDRTVGIFASLRRCIDC
jgi:hypothetical protein